MLRWQKPPPGAFVRAGLQSTNPPTRPSPLTLPSALPPNHPTSPSPLTVPPLPNPPTRPSPLTLSADGASAQRAPPGSVPLGTRCPPVIHNSGFRGFTNGLGVRHVCDASLAPLPLGPFRAVTYFRHPKVVNKSNWLNVVGHLVNDLQADKVPQYVDLPLQYLPKSDLKKLGTLIKYMPYLFPDPQKPAVLIGFDTNDDGTTLQLMRDHTIMYKAHLSSGQPSSLEMQGAIQTHSHLGMSRLQCLAIIVAAVFRIDLLPDAQGQLLNFSGLYNIPNIWKGRPLHPRAVSDRKEKAKCFVNYIRRGLNFDSQEATETVEFSRRSNIDINMMYIQQQANAPLRCVAFQTTLIENNEGGLHHDFANMRYGGGVLGFGSVQEESYIAQHPESLIPRRLYPVMDDATTIISKGHRQYSQVSHFSQPFQFLQDQQDSFQKPRILVATDAKSFGHTKNQTDYTQIQPVSTPLLTQFEIPLVRREIHKLVSGFGANVVEDTDAVAHTGKYGCGAFGGNEAMKFLIQWLAMSVCQVDMTYCKQLTDAPELDQIYSLLQGKTVGYLWTLLQSLAQPPFRQTLAQTPPASWNSEVLQFVVQYVANN